MLGSQLGVRTISGAGVLTDYAQTTTTSCRISSSRSYCSSLPLLRRRGCSFQLLRSPNRHCMICRKPSRATVEMSSKSSRGSSGRKSNHSEDRDGDYLEAVVLVSETIKHHRMRLKGFQENTQWESFAHLSPFSVRANDPRGIDVSFIGTGFLRRYQSPTIFLKISCDGDFVLPIIVGEYAVERLIDSLYEDQAGDCPNQFQLIRNLLEKLDYESGETDIISVDARPSDAINVANRCKAPIFVNKEIVLTDAIRMVHGMARSSNAKAIYDVSLDSASDGPDLLSEELVLMRNMNSAVKQERYSEAVMWREKLIKLRESKLEH
ncbi:bifunctional nuclease 2 isoform X2 [Ipomoea triloba]|uniref:bifunctional nuclease 2 isoform X2 n=1 Tax=Ipomoea triloba TaxID=35885 RepID=UPI00125E0FE6|nr:bifunctional nuclease 2 isoform X2 [Ipomoea triloba]